MLMVKGLMTTKDLNLVTMKMIMTHSNFLTNWPIMMDLMRYLMTLTNWPIMKMIMTHSNLKKVMAINLVTRWP